ncbi:YtxH domain-containing protein [Maridesulfovibrio ferrireducens]|uniref:YtxH domain-containing protein n=1 Tax=Maridesulfovibrio ferrireducens TaxID=246191 RepID=UPI001A198336|nr:YtxH domain-containing protein [Maridesulfovibrio ferrireducens]MBI9112764.1 YtxH domain-containing protein [Maridesulfovibrio ferrireducens]
MSQDYNSDYTYYYQAPPVTAYPNQVVPVQQPVQQIQPVQPIQAENAPSRLKSWVNVTDSRYLKGIAIGAGVALVASNPKVQKAVVSGSVRIWTAIQGGIEEAKEKIQDIKAEVSQSK